MKKRFVGVLLCTALSASMLAGCGGKKEEAPAVTESAAEETVETVEEETAAKEAEIANVTGTVTFTVDMSKYDKGSKVRVWIPVAQTNDYQTVEDVNFEIGELNTDADGNQMLYVEWDEETDPETRVASVSFKASRDEIIAPELVEEGEVEGMDEYLGESAMVVTTGEVKELADEITAGQDTVLGKARAIYDWIYDNMVRDNDVVGCGQGDVCTLINTKAGKCTDINSTFVALCRAAGVPAREMFGVRMNDEVITNNEHCWAQFYLPGTGWVSADPADVLKAVLTNEWDKADQEALDCKEYYWGSCDPKRVELSRGRDLTLSPAQDGEALNDFGYPYAEVDGEVVDFYAPDEFVYTITFAAE